MSLHKVACILHKKGELEKAVDAFEQTRKAIQELQTAQRELARALYHLSLVKREMGEEMEAEKLLDSAWVIRTGITKEGRKTTEDTNGFDDLVLYFYA